MPMFLALPWEVLLMPSLFLLEIPAADQSPETEEGIAERNNQGRRKRNFGNNGKEMERRMEAERMM